MINYDKLKRKCRQKLDDCPKYEMLLRYLEYRQQGRIPTTYVETITYFDRAYRNQQSAKIEAINHAPTNFKAWLALRNKVDCREDFVFKC